MRDNSMFETLGKKQQTIVENLLKSAWQSADDVLKSTEEKS